MSAFYKLIAYLRSFSTRNPNPAAQSVEAKFNTWSAGRRFLLNDSQR